MCKKNIGEPVFFAKRAHHLLIFNFQDFALRNRSSGCHADGLIRGDTSFAHEIAGAEQCDSCFLALLGDHAEPYSAVLNVIHSIRWLSLRKDGLFQTILTNSPPDATFG